jgi:hypothetical protein
MAGQGLQDLVGRVMIDGDFLQALVRDPGTVLADYQLSQEERASVLRAIAKLARVPATEQAGSLRTTLVKRWAT